MKNSALFLISGKSIQVISIKAYLKNRTVRALMSASVFETLGISIFNIVLLTYARSFQHANVFVSIASVASILPGTFGALMGRLADNTGKKSQALILTKIVQAALYILLANIITTKTVLIFVIVIMINMGSDLVGAYNNGLRVPIIQKRVPQEIRRTTLGVSQSITMFLQPIGQSIGVTVLGITHSYAMAGYINALTFLIAAFILYLGRSSIQLHLSVVDQKNQISLHAVLQQIKIVLESATEINMSLLIISIMLLNSLAAGLSVIINLSLLKLTLVFSYGVAVLLVSIANISGAIIGSLLNTKLTSKMSVQMILSFINSCLLILFINLWLVHSFFLILVPYFLLGWGIGKFNPKLNAEVMKLADPHIIGSIFGTITSIATIASPIGSVGLVLLYNLVPTWITFSIAIALLVLQLSFAGGQSISDSFKKMQRRR